MRQASEEAQRKAAEAETVKQAEQERLKAEAEREKAQAERQKAEAEAKAKAEAETAEKALHLEQADRQRLQVALTSLGFDTRGSDGVFGLRTRDMIASWQKKAGASATGFLTAPQRDQILRSAAPALARWDKDQNKLEGEKRDADTSRPNTTAFALPSPVVEAPASPPTATAPLRASASMVLSSTMISGCARAGYERVPVTMYPDRIEARMPWGWETLKVGVDGSFSGTVTGPVMAYLSNTPTATRLAVRGNVKSKEMRFELLGPTGGAACIWTGMIS